MIRPIGRGLEPEEMPAPAPIRPQTPPAAQAAGTAGVPREGTAVPGAQEAKRGSEERGSGRFDRNACQMCENRKYQDGSDDPGVSFKTPSRVDPRAAASAVRGHEMEHVFRERGKALREGREVVSQSVTLHTGICPECGRVYISGGTTRTTTRASDELDEILRQEAPAAGGKDRTEGAE